ncbi:MAG TPA: F0F1 ATP synthase subunit epsilon [Anaerolineales bacterium]|jgi:F-type H+-transporting ATPase subunit epsilon|nr:F0F1 ATP synthase subunit epsilon [Anaerolineales bacterium]
MTIRCEIVSQDRTVFQGDVDIVILPGVAGEMGILPNHAPVLTILKYGVIKVRQGSKEELFAVAGGMAEVQPTIVTILADAAENIMDIDITRAQAAKKRAEDALAKINPEEQDTYLRMEAALRRSNLRLDVARRYRRVKDVFTDKDASM